MSKKDKFNFEISNIQPVRTYAKNIGATHMFPTLKRNKDGHPFITFLYKDENDDTKADNIRFSNRLSVAMNDKKLGTFIETGAPVQELNLADLQIGKLTHKENGDEIWRIMSPADAAYVSLDEVF